MAQRSQTSGSLASDEHRYGRSRPDESVSLQGILGIAKSQGSRAGRHSVGDCRCLFALLSGRRLRESATGERVPKEPTLHLTLQGAVAVDADSGVPL
jgi:hypothetical protein